MSISSSMTVDIYRSDGTIHPGPRWDWGAGDRHPQFHLTQQSGCALSTVT